MMMIDREKVIKGLEHCRQYGRLGGKDCNGIFSYTDSLEDIVKSGEHRHDCPYGKCKTGCVVTLVDDAIVLLKEQEKRINELEEKPRLMKYGDQDTLQSGMMPAT